MDFVVIPLGVVASVCLRNVNMVKVFGSSPEKMAVSFYCPSTTGIELEHGENNVLGKPLLAAAFVRPIIWIQRV